MGSICFFFKFRVLSFKPADLYSQFLDKSIIYRRRRFLWNFTYCLTRLLGRKSLFGGVVAFTHIIPERVCGQRQVFVYHRRGLSHDQVDGVLTVTQHPEQSKLSLTQNRH